MALVFHTSDTRWSLRPLQSSDTRRILRYLEDSYLMNVFLISRILDEGLPATNSMEVRHGEDTICIASVSGNVVLAARHPRDPAKIASALALVAARITSKSIPVRAIVSEAELVEPLWQHLERRIDPPTVVRLEQPVYALDHDNEMFSDLRAVRYATTEDMETLVPACAAMHTEEVGINPLDRDAFSYRERIRELVTSRRSLLMMEGSRIVFKCEFSAVTPEAVQLMGVWTAPPFRRKGYARRALQEICGHVIREGRKLTLFVNHFNQPAIHLYETLGFRQIGRNRALIW